MTKTYSVKEGDTLLEIAIEHQVDFNELLVVNPQFMDNPDRIFPGEVVTLLLAEEKEEADESTSEKSDVIEPVSRTRPVAEKACLGDKPECKGDEIIDVLFETGMGPEDYYCLDESSLEALKEESAIMELMAGELHQLQQSAPQGEVTDTQKQSHAAKRWAWMEKAVYAGMLEAPPEPEQSTPEATIKKAEPLNLRQVEDKLTRLRQRLTFVAIYHPPFLERNSSIFTLRDKTLEAIEGQITYWEEQAEKIKGQTKKQGNMPLKQSVNLGNFRQVGGETPSAGVKELFLAGENRRLYVRDDFLKRERKYWKKTQRYTRAQTALQKRDFEGVKQALYDDIKKDILKAKESPVLKANLKKWTLGNGDPWQEWQGSTKFRGSDGNTRFAVSAEAQLMRWGAQAAVGGDYNLTEGKLDIGMGVDAAISLAEGAVAFDCYLPHDKGYSLTLSYTDANKNPAEYSFGHFRLRGNMTLSCFVGVMGEVKAQGTNRVEQQGGHGILLSPSVDLGIRKDRSGQIGVKAGGFAGGQLGGQVIGAAEWRPPLANTDNRAKDEKSVSAPGFKALATVKAEANIALGAGVEGVFKLELRDGKFYLHLKAGFVWGPGGSGGFGAEIDLGAVWELANVIWDGLQYVDYRLLKNIDDEAYTYLRRSSYLAFALGLINPVGALKEAILVGKKQLDDWWGERKDDEAYQLTNRILNEKAWSGVSADKLLPETIGMMLNTLLVKCFVMFEIEASERRETAICFLLKESVYNWRKFEEVLCRINPEGEKQEGDAICFDNLERINAILDGKQQQEFNQWVNLLAKHDRVVEVVKIQAEPFTPSYGSDYSNKKEMIRRQINSLST